MHAACLIGSEVLLEAEVAECLVGFGHAVNFVTALHGAATAFGGLEQFVGQALGHGLLAALAGGFLQPTHGQGQATHGAHFDGHLVVGTANTAGLHFDHGLDVVDGNNEGFQRVFVRVLLLNQVQGTVDDAFCDRLLAMVGMWLATWVGMPMPRLT